jgi:hypothetical protein|tara:strand:- start:2742 stop:3302 length:561 start_codon:yes stop_codon:yes gene_type:complete
MISEHLLQGVIIFVAIFVLGYLIYDYGKRKKQASDTDEPFEDYEFVSDEIEKNIEKDIESSKEPTRSVAGNTESSPKPLGKTQKSEPYPRDCFPRDKLTPDDLLPKDAANSQWAKVNPAGQGDVKNQNFLTAGYHVGINSTGSTLRNANMQIRSEPPNPQQKVSPWMQTTIEPDLNRQPLEINGSD